MSRFKPVLQTLFWVVSDLLFPRHCQVCLKIMDHGNRAYLCESCYGSIRFISNTACRGCAKGFPGMVGAFCALCSRTRLCYEACYAICTYDGPIKELLQLFKFSKAEYLANTLQKIFLGGVFKRIDLEKIDGVIPIPLHPLKLKERGFNQSLILAEVFKRMNGFRLFQNGLKRIKYSQGQTLQDKKARAKNIQGSFVVSDPGKIGGKSILLVDDVLTTGATLQECARVLKEAGAKRVTVLVLARSV